MILIEILACKVDYLIIFFQPGRRVSCFSCTFIFLPSHLQHAFVGFKNVIISAGVINNQFQFKLIIHSYGIINFKLNITGFSVGYFKVNLIINFFLFSFLRKKQARKATIKTVRNRLFFILVEF